MKEQLQKKKISRKDWTYIGKLNYAAKWCRPFCSYTLVKKNDTTFIRYQALSLIMYLLLFIPVHFIQFFECLWDGGLREFTILKRALGHDYIVEKQQTAFVRAEQIWNGEKPYKKEPKERQ